MTIALSGPAVLLLILLFCPELRREIESALASRAFWSAVLKAAGCFGVYCLGIYTAAIIFNVGVLWAVFWPALLVLGGFKGLVALVLVFAVLRAVCIAIAVTFSR